LLFRTEEKTGHRLMQFTWTRPFTFNHPCSHLLDATLCETGPTQLPTRLTKVGSMNTFFPDVELEPPQSVKWGYYVCFFLCTSPHVEPVQRRSVNLVGGPQLFYAMNRNVQMKIWSRAPVKNYRAHLAEEQTILFLTVPFVQLKKNFFN
jgi:hypothetical protein